MSRTFVVTRTLVFGTLFLIGMTSAAMGDDDHRRGGGGHGGHGDHGGGDHGHGGQNFFGLSSGGLSYGFQNDHFGFQLGPVGGYEPYNHYPQPAYAPVYVPDAQFGYAEPIVNDYGGYPQPMISAPIAPETTRVIDAPAPGLANSNAAAETFYRQSVEAFRSGDYQGATRASDHAIIEDSNSGFLRLHAAQCLFANGEFDAAATALADGLGMSEKSEWGREVKNFRDLYRKNDYITHMKQLEKFVAENPQSAFGNALAAYHFNYLGHADAAQRHLEAARKADVQNELVGLLSSVIGNQPAESLPEPASISILSK